MTAEEQSGAVKDITLAVREHSAACGQSLSEKLKRMAHLRRHSVAVLFADKGDFNNRASPRIQEFSFITRLFDGLDQPHGVDSVHQRLNLAAQASTWRTCPRTGRITLEIHTNPSRVNATYGQWYAGGGHAGYDITAFIRDFEIGFGKSVVLQGAAWRRMRGGKTSAILQDGFPPMAVRIVPLVGGTPDYDAAHTLGYSAQNDRVIVQDLHGISADQLPN